MSLIYDIYNEDIEKLEKKVRLLKKQLLLEKRKVRELHELCIESDMYWMMKEARKIVEAKK